MQTSPHSAVMRKAQSILISRPRPKSLSTCVAASTASNFGRRAKAKQSGSVFYKPTDSTGFLTQTKRAFDLRVMDDGEVLLVNLAKGKICGRRLFPAS